jgi:hypothetical protein
LPTSPAATEAVFLIWIGGGVRAVKIGVRSWIAPCPETTTRQRATPILSYERAHLRDVPSETSTSSTRCACGSDVTRTSAREGHRGSRNPPQERAAQFPLFQIPPKNN